MIAGSLVVAIQVITDVANAPALRAQAQAGERFEVASVRRVDIPATDKGVPVFPTTGGIGTANPTRIAYRATWLNPLIAEAFDVRSDQITGPEWLNRERYDIVANIPEGATKDQFKVMLGNLLRDRFQLRFHMDSKTGPVYALRVAKNGPALKETAVRLSDNGTVPSGSVKSAADAQGFPVMSPEYRGMVGRPANSEMFWAAQDVPMATASRRMPRRIGDAISGQ